MNKCIALSRIKLLNTHVLTSSNLNGIVPFGVFNLDESRQGTDHIRVVEARIVRMVFVEQVTISEVS